VEKGIWFLYHRKGDIVESPCPFHRLVNRITWEFHLQNKDKNVKGLEA